VLRRNSRREATANPREPAYLDPWGWPGTDPIPAPVIVGPGAGEERPGRRPRVNWAPFHDRSGFRFTIGAGPGASRSRPRDHGRNPLSTVLVSRFAVPWVQVRTGIRWPERLGSRHTALGPTIFGAGSDAGPVCPEPRRRGFQVRSPLFPGSRPWVQVRSPLFPGSRPWVQVRTGTLWPERLGSRHTGPASDPAPEIVGPMAGDERPGRRPRDGAAAPCSRGSDRAGRSARRDQGTPAAPVDLACISGRARGRRGSPGGDGAPPWRLPRGRGSAASGAARCSVR